MCVCVLERGREGIGDKTVSNTDPACAFGMRKRSATMMIKCVNKEKFDKNTSMKLDAVNVISWRERERERQREREREREMVKMFGAIERKRETK